MSKLAILKELTDLRALAQRKSLLRRGAVIAALGYLLIGFGRDGWTYLSTATRMVTDNVRSKVPLEFELERARTMIDGLIPDVRQNMLVIAQEEVGVENLRRDVERVQAELGKQREEILRMRADISGNEKTFRLGSRTVNQEEIKEELSRRFSRFQVSEATVASKQQLLAAREKSLDAARARLDNMLNAKRDLEVQVENLQARFKTQQSQTLATSLEVNDSQVARCRGLLDEMSVRLEVADRLFASNGDFSAMTSATVPSKEDIGRQIDHYFSQSSNGKTLAASR